MNNLDKIIEKITRDAEQTAAGIKERTEREIAGLSSETSDKISDKEKLVRAQIQRDAEASRQLDVSVGEMNRNRILLSAKVKMIDKAYEKAEDYFHTMPRGEYAALLSRLLGEAAAERLGSVEIMTSMYGDEEYCTDFEVIFNDEDRRELSGTVIEGALKYLAEKSADWKKTKISVSDDTAAINGGFILRYGDIESNCSIQALIDHSRTQTDSAVAAVLFGADS